MGFAASAPLSGTDLANVSCRRALAWASIGRGRLDRRLLLEASRLQLCPRLHRQSRCVPDCFLPAKPVQCFHHDAQKGWHRKWPFCEKGDLTLETITMQSLTNAATSLSGVATLGGVIAFHEAGHFLAARSQVAFLAPDFALGRGPCAGCDTWLY